MNEYDYDLLVIGAGSGGVRAARIAASLGARVAVFEADRLGGTCVNRGCVPKKLLVYGSHYGRDFKDSAGYGWTVPPASLDWPTLARRVDDELTRLNGIYDRILSKSGAEIIRGRAEVVGPNQIRVADRRYTGTHLLVATGSRPFRPPIPGIDLAITSDEIFSLPELPRRILIWGGGYIAIEFATILRGLGVEVTLVHRGDHLLRGFDRDLRLYVEHDLRTAPVELLLETTVSKITGEQGSELLATLDDGRELVVDHVLCATGRVPNTDDLGLEAVGVKLSERGAVLADSEFRTHVPSIRAIGDVIDHVQLTPVALEEGTALARHLFADEPIAVDYDLIPTAVFSQPPAATVGPSEEEARKRCGDVVVYRSVFKPMKHTLTDRDEKAMVKLLVDPNTDRVIAAHMVGPDAGEVMQGIAIAIRAGATKAHFDATLGIHPTGAEEFVTLREPVAS